MKISGAKALSELLAVNKRLNVARLLRDSFGHLWRYEREGWTRRFFRELMHESNVATYQASSEVRREG